MAEAQLNIRSTRAKNLANALAKQQQRSVTQIVELALERLSTELPKVKSEKPDAANFWRKLNKSLYPTGREPDIDLEAIVAEHRKPHEPLKF